MGGRGRGSQRPATTCRPANRPLSPQGRGRPGSAQGRPEGLSRRVADAVHACQGERGLMLLFGPDAEVFTGSALSISLHDLRRGRLKDGEGLLPHLVASDRPVLLTDREVEVPGLMDGAVRTIMSAPLLVDGRAWGVLVCANGGGAPPVLSQRLKRLEAAGRSLGQWARQAVESPPEQPAGPREPDRYAQALSEIAAAAASAAGGHQVLEAAARHVAQAVGGAAFITQGDLIVACSRRFPRVGEPVPAALAPWTRRPGDLSRLVCLDLRGRAEELEQAGWPRSISRQAYGGVPLGDAGDGPAALHVFPGRMCDERDAWFLSLAGQCLESWLARRRAERDRLRDVAELAIVCQLGQTVGGSLAVERLLAAAMSNVAQAMSADTCSLVVADRASGELIVDAAYGLSEGIIKGERGRVGRGIASYVIEHGQPVVIGDPRTDPRLTGIPFDPRPEVQSAICVPIKLAGSVDAVVSISRRHDPRPFTQDDLNLACDLADQLIPCVENARLYQQTAERLRALSTVPEVAEALRSSLDLSGIVRLLAKRIAALAGAPRCRLYRHLAASRRLVPLSSAGHPDPRDEDTLPADRGAMGRALKEGRPVRVIGGGRGSAATAEEREQAGTDCFLVIPIKARDQVVGVACLDCEPGDAGRVLDFDLPLLERLVASAAIAVQNALAHGELRDSLAELTVLQQAAQRINASLTAYALLVGLEQAAKQVAEARRVRFALFDLPTESDVAAQCGPMLIALEPGSPALAAARRIRKPLAARPGRTGDAGLDALLRHAKRPEKGWVLIVPLLHREGALGVAVASGLAGEPTPKQRALLSAVFSHGAAALRHALEHEQMLRQQSGELSALYDLSEQITAATSPQAAMESVLDFASNLIPYDRAAVLIWHEERKALELQAGRGLEAGPSSPERRALENDEAIAWVAREGKAFLSADASAPGGQPRLRARMLLPLLIGNRCIGVLAFQSTAPQAYSETQVKMLSVVAAQAAAIHEALRSLGQLSRYTENILQSIVAGVIGLDHAGRIVIWSPMAEAILQCPAEEAVGRLFDPVVEEIARRQQAPALTSLSLIVRKVTQSGTASTGHELSLTDGSAPSRSLSVGCSPLHAGEGEPPGAVMLLEDISERRQLEERMLRVNQLATIGHLAANVAHEVRNPLSAIKTAAQFLKTEYAHEELVGQFAGIINAECDRLSKVTTDFLVYARPPSPRFEPVRLEDAIERSLQVIGPESDHREIQVVCDYAQPLPTILADAQELQQVFLNLLSNAMQAIEANGRITIRAEQMGEEGEAAVEVTIRDTGRGIPEAYLKDVFTPFFTTKTKGTGLGLAIVRKIVEAHGGTISAESTPRRGATFTLRLPVAARPDASAQAGAPRPVLADAELRAQLPLFRDDSG